MIKTLKVPDSGDSNKCGRGWGVGGGGGGGGLWFGHQAEANPNHIIKWKPPKARAMDKQVFRGEECNRETSKVKTRASKRETQLGISDARVNTRHFGECEYVMVNMSTADMFVVRGPLYDVVSGARSVADLSRIDDSS